MLAASVHQAGRCDSKCVLCSNCGHRFSDNTLGTQAWKWKNMPWTEALHQQIPRHFCKIWKISWVLPWYVWRKSTSNSRFPTPSHFASGSFACSRHNIKKCSDRLQYFEKETQKQTLGGAFQEASEIHSGWWCSIDGVIMQTIISQWCSLMHLVNIGKFPEDGSYKRQWVRFSSNFAGSVAPHINSCCSEVYVLSRIVRLPGVKVRIPEREGYDNGWYYVANGHSTARYRVVFLEMFGKDIRSWISLGKQKQMRGKIKRWDKTKERNAILTTF